jgi:hypothetical protein
MDSETHEMERGMLSEELTSNITKITAVTLSPLPTNFQATVSSFLPEWEGDDGRRGKYNIPVIGVIRVNYSGKDKYAELPYGKKGDAFYIAQLISYKIPGKALNVHVDNLPTFLTYTGYWVYVKDGEEISVIINDQTNQFREGWGDYVKYCIVQRTSTNQMPGIGNYFKFRVTEDLTNVIFESGQITNTEPVSYERK